jgi:hypothetical protein
LLHASDEFAVGTINIGEHLRPRSIVRRVEDVGVDTIDIVRQLLLLTPFSRRQPIGAMLGPRRDVREDVFE